MNNNHLRELWLREHQTLRDEIISLKECQIDILKWAYSIVGGILVIALGFVLKNGGISKEQLVNNGYALSAIFALFVGTILGSFIVQIIVHKTRSIFRMCGYVQLLEKLLSSHHQLQGPYPGYENAYHELRRIQNENKMGFEISFRRTVEEFFQDLESKLKILKKVFRRKDSSESESDVSGKYYRRIAFQIHLLNFLCLCSGIFLLIIIRQQSWWFLVTCLFGVLAAWLWLYSVIRCMALTRMQEGGAHSISGQFDLWCQSIKNLGYMINEDCKK